MTGLFWILKIKVDVKRCKCFYFGGGEGGRGGGLECVGHPFCIFKRRLDSNPERCPSRQARYQPTYPPISMTINLQTQLKHRVY